MADTLLRFGRKPPVERKLGQAMRLGPLLTGTVPPPPPEVDYGRLFRTWQMLGNDRYGDCVSVSWANQRALTTTALTGDTDYPSEDQVLEFYKTQNPRFPDQDEGMVVQYALDELRKNGGPDGVKLVAFARVDPTDVDELKAAHAIFGQVLYGVNVQRANMEQFEYGGTWDYVRNSPIIGGHAITGVGYSPSEYRFITWGEETRWTEAFRRYLVDEAWVLIWPEHLGTREFQEGVDVQALADWFHQLTGGTIDIPNPPPPIAPPPPPPADIDQQFIDAVDAWREKHKPKRYRDLFAMIDSWAERRGSLES